ncbi:GntR family transcriptional regulator [Paenibacillus chitinolyticus]|uniref:GntR family transcriptional regulator n=1 Tax=Paenibacillus chitinolyticus TaxID=79263 RepID=UPI00386F0DF7
MPEQFSGSQPIYLQLVQRVCRQIIRKEFPAGGKLPSVRELAVQFGVNPNTVQRVNMELERMGVVESRRGQGMFVTEDESLLTRLRDELKEGELKRFAEEMRDLGYSNEQIIKNVQKFLKLN